MVRSELLSQDEIDALLQGVENSEVDLHTPPSGEGEVRVYDFCQQEQVVPGNLPMLDMINERFARRLKRSLFDFLRNKVDISVSGVQAVKFSEYLHSQPVPTSLNLLGIEPLHENALCVIEPELVFHTVDAYFGGTCRYTDIEDRDFSPTENRLIHLLLQQVLMDLNWSWKPFMPLDFSLRDMEADSYLAQMIWPDDTALVCDFRVDFADAAGNLAIVLPQKILKQTPRLARAGMPRAYLEHDQQWCQALREELHTAQLTLNCTLSQTEMRLSDLLKLQVGDVVPIDSAESITISAENVPIYRGTYGVFKGRKAVKIQEHIARSGKEPARRNNPASDKE